MARARLATARAATLATALALLSLAATATAGVQPLPVGSVAPAFQLPALDGKGALVSVASLRGKVVLLNFWASWCGPCRKEMPILEQINHQYGKRGVVVVGVNVEPDRSAALDWLKETPVSFPVLSDTDSHVSAAYHVEGMPNTVILDRKGNVRYVHRSYVAGTEDEYLDQVRQLIRE
jgi:DsbE subfamily thiol:disulfide oxidoreductase